MCDDSRVAPKEAAGAPKTTSAIEELAEILFVEMDRCDPSERYWRDLNEGEKEIYRTCIEGIIIKWSVVQKAHAEMTICP